MMFTSVVSHVHVLGEGATLEQLRHCLSVLITSTTEIVTRDMIQKTWQEIEFRLDVSRATNVAHIEMY
jgi:DNA-binding winged helix-turn-helix (wHTH) protein